MSRHAGFAAVSTVSGALANSVLKGYFEEAGLRFFQLRQTLPLGAASLSVSGLMQLLTPSVELRASTQNTIGLNLQLEGKVSFQSGTRVWQRNLRIVAKAAASLTTALQPREQTGLSFDRFLVGIDPATFTINSFVVSVIDGPGLSPQVLAVLNSSAVVQVLTMYLRANSPVPLTQTLNLDTLRQVITKPEPDQNQAWFTINLRISRIVARIFDGALTVGIDLEGLTNGDYNQLTDLLTERAFGNAYSFTKTPNSQVSSYAPPDPIYRARGGNIAASFNIAVIRWLTQSVSSQISGRLIRIENPKRGSEPATISEVTPRGIGLEFGSHRFPLFPSEMSGFKIRAGVEIHQTGPDPEVTAEVLIYPLATFHDDYWRDQPKDGWDIISKTIDVDLPWWVDAAPYLLGFTCLLWMPLEIFGVDAFGKAIDKINNAPNKVPKLGLSLNGMIPDKLPGLDKRVFESSCHYCLFSPDGIDLAFDCSVQHPLEKPVATIQPDSWSLKHNESFYTNFDLRADYAALGAGVTVKIDVKDGRDMSLISTATKAYNSLLGLWPTVPFDNRTEKYYFLDKIVVDYVVSINSPSLSGELLAGRHIIHISDSLNRFKKIVRWGPRTVLFKNEGTGRLFWQRTRTSKLHRTALRARCLELKRNAEDWKNYSPKKESVDFVYDDDLPFSWDDLNAHRHELCEYCFFGGPDKSTPFPKDDWFTR